MPDLSASKKTSFSAPATLLVICVVLFLFLLSLALYTLVHEGGHALVGLLLGGKINTFSANFFDLSAHVVIDGEFTPAQHALISVAGISLPLLLCAAFLILTAQKGDILLYTFKTTLFLVTVNTLLAWIFIPILALMGQAVSDDSFGFLKYTGIQPLVETGAALFVYIGCWILFLDRMGGARSWMDRFRDASRAAPIALLWPGTRKTALSLGAVGCVVLVSSLGLALAFPEHPFTAPPGFQQVAELDLSQASLSDQIVYQLTVDRPTRVSLYFLLNDINGAPVNLRLTGPDGFENVFLSMTDPDTRMGQASVNPKEMILEKGKYEIRVSLPACRGRVKVYVKES